jgi:hypothetical protein
MEYQPRNSAKLDVDQQAAETGALGIQQKILARVECQDVEAGPTHQPPQRATLNFVVINDCNEDCGGSTHTAPGRLQPSP